MMRAPRSLLNYRSATEPNHQLLWLRDATLPEPRIARRDLTAVF
jgi:hypothetical protein